MPPSPLPEETQQRCQTPGQGTAIPTADAQRPALKRGWDQLPLQPAAPEGCAFEEDGVFLDEDSLISAVL